MNTASKSIFTLVFAITFSLVSISTLSAQTVWLDQLDLSPATQGWGIPKKNRSVDGNIMTIAGKTFERGFGTHAESSLFIQLDGKANSFTAQVGIEVLINNTAFTGAGSIRATAAISSRHPCGDGISGTNRGIPPAKRTRLIKPT